MEPIILIIYGVLCVIFCIIAGFSFLASSTIIVNEGDVVVLERLGKFSRVLKAGVHLAIPIIYRKKTVRWTSIQEFNGVARPSVFSSFLIPFKREIIFDPSPIDCLTKNGANVLIDTAIRLMIEDVVMCVYEVDDLYRSLQILVESILFKLVQERDIETVINNRGQLGTEAQKELNENVKKWGITIIAVDIQHMQYPNEITQSIMTYLTKEQENKVILAAEEGRRRLELSKLLSQAEIEKQIHNNNMEKIMQERKEELERAETEALKKLIEAKSKDDTLRILFGENVTNKQEYILDEMRYTSLLHSKSSSVVIPHDLKLLTDRFVSA